MSSYHVIRCHERTRPAHTSAFHGGTRHNIIPDEARLQLTIRAYKEEVRQAILAAIERIAVNAARGAGLPDHLLPTVTVNPVYA